MAISLIDALSQTEDKTKPFQMKYVSFNKSAKTGGDIIELTKGERMGAKYHLNNQDMIVVKQQGNKHHPHPIHIHLIVEFNNQPIFI